MVFWIWFLGQKVKVKVTQCKTIKILNHYYYYYTVDNALVVIH